MPNLTADKKIDTIYLGDGVYCGHDHYQVWIWCERYGEEHSIALEPGLITLLTNYERDINKKYGRI